MSSKYLIIFCKGTIIITIASTTDNIDTSIQKCVYLHVLIISYPYWNHNRKSLGSVTLHVAQRKYAIYTKCIVPENTMKCIIQVSHVDKDCARYASGKVA